MQTPRKKHPIEAQIESSEDELPPLIDDDSDDGDDNDEGDDDDNGDDENEMSDVEQTSSASNLFNSSM